MSKPACLRAGSNWSHCLTESPSRALGLRMQAMRDTISTGWVCNLNTLNTRNDEWGAVPESGIRWAVKPISCDVRSSWPSSEEGV